MDKEIVHLRESVDHLFDQIQSLLENLSEEEYYAPCRQIFGATIGQHVRHIIELFIELENGYLSGTVNYEKRKRDFRIESDKYFAISLLNDISGKICRKNRKLILDADFNTYTNENIQMETSYYRELAFNIDHTIHHMALIRVGVNEVSGAIIDEEFGIAFATIKHRKLCVR